MKINIFLRIIRPDIYHILYQYLHWWNQSNSANFLLGNNIFLMKTYEKFYWICLLFILWMLCTHAYKVGSLDNSWIMSCCVNHRILQSEQIMHVLNVLIDQISVLYWKKSLNLTLHWQILDQTQSIARKHVDTLDVLYSTAPEVLDNPNIVL